MDWIFFGARLIGREASATRTLTAGLTLLQMKSFEEPAGEQCFVIQNACLNREVLKVFPVALNVLRGKK